MVTRPRTITLTYWGLEVRSSARSHGTFLSPGLVACRRDGGEAGGPNKRARVLA